MYSGKHAITFSRRKTSVQFSHLACRDLLNIILAPNKYSKHFLLCHYNNNSELRSWWHYLWRGIISNIGVHSQHLINDVFNWQEIISNAVQLFCPYYECEYPKCQQVKDGLKRLLHDRYRNDATNFVDKFVHPTLSLLGDLKDLVIVHLYIYDEFLSGWILGILNMHIWPCNEMME